MKDHIQCIAEAHGEDWSIYHGDCVELARQWPSSSVRLGLHSPPFSHLYTYSDSERDMGNSLDDEQFFRHYGYLIREHYRIMVPSGLVAVHCKQLVDYKGADGRAGLRDFRGEIIRAWEAGGFKYHSEVTIWKSAPQEMRRTNAHGLLYKTLREDASFTRQGLAEYLVIFRKWPETEAEEAWAKANRIRHDPTQFTLEQWQEWASPVWTTISTTNVLNVEAASEDKDEKHMCLASGSLVLTFDGYKPIETVNVGDLVLTHQGRWKPVTAKSQMGRRRVIKLEAQGVPGLVLTPDHPVWTRKGRTAHPRKMVPRAEPEWVDAEDTLGHYVNLPLPPEADGPSALGEDEWWIIGRWLGDGFFDARDRVHISCGHHEADALIKRLGDHAGHVARYRTSVDIALKDPDGRLRSMLVRCGRGAAGKVLPAEALSLPLAKAAQLLGGYMSADGHYAAQYDRWSSVSVSRALVLGMAIVAQRVRDVAVSVYGGREGGVGVIEGREVQTQKEWVMSIPPRNLSAVMMSGGAWKKVRRLSDAGEAEVWDLRIADDESFVAEGCVVHNCPLQLDVIDRAVVLWSNEGDVVLSPFAGVGSEGVGALRRGRRFVGFELKDSYFQRQADNLRAEEPGAAGQQTALPGVA